MPRKIQQAGNASEQAGDTSVPAFYVRIGSVRIGDTEYKFGDTLSAEQAGEHADFLCAQEAIGEGDGSNEFPADGLDANAPDAALPDPDAPDTDTSLEGNATSPPGGNSTDNQHSDEGNPDEQAQNQDDLHPAQG